MVGVLNHPLTEKIAVGATCLVYLISIGGLHDVMRGLMGLASIGASISVFVYIIVNRTLRVSKTGIDKALVAFDEFMSDPRHKAETPVYSRLDVSQGELSMSSFEICRNRVDGLGLPSMCVQETDSVDAVKDWISYHVRLPQTDIARLTNAMQNRPMNAHVYVDIECGCAILCTYIIKES